MIQGQNFAQNAEVFLNSAPSNSIALTQTSFIDPQRLQAIVPASLSPGIYDVMVQNANGRHDTFHQGYVLYGAGDDDLYSIANQLWIQPKAPRALSSTQIGLSIHRPGGKRPLTDVNVRFYLGDPTGTDSDSSTLISEATIPILSPRSIQSTNGASWTPPSAGDYEIYAVIDPDNRITETLEENNTVYRTITVLLLSPDQDAPHVDDFSINDGAASTEQQAVLLNTTASDPEPGSGVAKLRFIEFEYSQGAERWIYANASEWLDYETSRTDYPWKLSPSVGVKILQAWAADRDGNISTFPYQAGINYIPPTDMILRNQGRIYRYSVVTGQQVTVHMESVSGDPDLYVWPPDHETRPPWVSNRETGADEVSFDAPVSGTYQVEVYGFTDAEYRLRVDISDGVNAATATVISQEKPIRSQPLVPINSLPRTDVAIPAAGQSTQEIFLPLVQR